jgi:hypothetical protein
MEEAALNESPQIFSLRHWEQDKLDEALIAALYRGIGQLKVEL